MENSKSFSSMEVIPKWKKVILKSSITNGPKSRQGHTASLVIDENGVEQMYIMGKMYKNIISFIIKLIFKILINEGGYDGSKLFNFFDDIWIFYFTRREWKKISCQGYITYYFCNKLVMLFKRKLSMSTI